MKKKISWLPLSPLVTMLGSIVGVAFAIIFAALALEFLIIVGFFLFQFCVKYRTYEHGRKGLPFLEAVLVGPAKVITGYLLFLVGSPDIVREGYWTAFILMFLASGFKNLFLLSYEWFGNSSKVFPTSSASVISQQAQNKIGQQKKNEHVTEEQLQLLADLTNFLSK